MFELACTYLDELNPQQDCAEAARWMRQAAESGLKDAQIMLSNMYRWGIGVPRSRKEAAMWRRKAKQNMEDR
ncbi:MAG: sel1 repeat family protein [Clostridia bacterium]|nr:sel1 repeat family protein [Clostridia bacterium]